MAQPFTSIKHPFTVDLGRGRLAEEENYAEHIEQMMFQVLFTAPGERINRPDFGCRIHDLMFAPNNDITAARAEVYCEEAIQKYEPRIEKVVVTANPHADQPNRLDVRIEYVIAGQNTKRNLVFPFYLKNEDDEGTATTGITNGQSVKNGVR